MGAYSHYFKSSVCRKSCFRISPLKPENARSDPGGKHRIELWQFASIIQFKWVRLISYAYKNLFVC